MRDKAASIAKWAVTAFTKPWDAVEQVGHGAIDRVVGWLPLDQRTHYQKLLEEVTRQLEALPRDALDHDDLEPALQMAEDLFKASGLTTDELVRRGLDGAIAEQRRRLDELLEQRGEATTGAEAGICRQHVIPAVVKGLFADRDALAEIDLAFKEEALKHLSEIDRLPGRVAEALQRLAGRAMLVRPFGRWDPDRHAQSVLLRAEYGSVDFEPRDKLVNEALAWRRTQEPVGIRLYVGAGGMGKTRLMIELCRRLEDLGEGWCAGFLSERSGEVPDWLMPSPYRADEPMFVVVDYAETRDLRRLFRMAHDWPKGGKLRIVLLAREAGEWWQTLPQLSAEAEALLPGPATRQEPTRIGAFTPDLSARRQLFDNAVGAFAKALDRDRSEVAPSPDLSQDDFQPILMIHLAAMAALDGKTIGSAEDLLKNAINREVQLWKKGLTEGHLAKLDSEDVRQAMALLTLVGGADSKSDAIELIGAAPRLPDNDDALREDLVGWLAQLYPSVAEAGDATRVEPLKPDLLGEVLVDRALQSWPELLPIALEAGPKPALTVLTRLAKHQQPAKRWLGQAFAHDLDGLAKPAMEVAIETGDPIGPVLARRLEEQELDDPSRLEPLIPEQTTALREVGVAVMQQMRARLQRQPEPWPEETKAEAARVANNLANRLSALGRREEALGAAQEAVAICRELAKARPDAFARDLALSLSVMADRLEELERIDDALAADVEAVRTIRPYFLRNPPAYAGQMIPRAQDYVRRCGKLGQDLDMELLAPILETLQRLQANAPEDRASAD